jgi:hypothetical protein
MASTNWGSAVSGNWDDGANWADTFTPASDADVTIDATGAYYRVLVNTAVEANSITVTASDAKFLETHDGSLDLAGTFAVLDGRASLYGDNSFGGGVWITGGSVNVGNEGALGDGALTMTGGSLRGWSTMTLAANDLTFGGDATIGARWSQVLTVGGDSTTIDAASTLHFGLTHYHGRVVFAAGDVNASAPYALSVDHGRLVAGDANFSTLTAGADSVTVAGGAVLSLGGMDADVHGLAGNGLVVAGGGLVNLSLHGDTEFDGSFAGHVHLHVLDSATLSGHQHFYGYAEIEGAQATLTIDGSFREGVRFSEGGELVIGENANFTGKIYNFDGDSTIDLKGFGTDATLDYDAETHQLTVSDDTHTASLRVMGELNVGNFAMSDDGAGGIDLNWQVAASAHPREMHHDAMPIVTDWFV